jgi:hypothetical protein
MAFRQKTADVDPLAAFLEESADGKVPTPAKPPVRWPKQWGRPAAMALLLIAGLAAGGWLAMRSWSTPPKLGTVTISTTPAGAEVLVGGISRGQSPVTFTVVPGRNSVVVVNGTQKIPVDFTVAAGGSVAQHVVFASGEPTVVASVPPPLPAPAKPAVDKPAADKPADQRIAAGWVSINSPMSLRILEGGQVIGSSELARVMLPAGSHDVELVNDELGFRERRRLTITLGKSTVVNVEPPKVPLNINATPWAEVSVDGRAAGETPIGNYPVGIGTHTIVFRHPDFGERQQRVTVGLKSPARVTVDMKKQ